VSITGEDLDAVLEDHRGGAPLGVQIDTIEDFAKVEEEGAAPLMGGDGNVLIPENGDVMVYGDGGSGKTTLMHDAACHLGAGQGWLGIPVPRRLNVLLVEVEGPRPLMRAKLRRRLDSWEGEAIDGRVRILRDPWGKFTFADERWRAELARAIDELQVDAVIAGPLTKIGMEEAGTLQQTRDFMRLVDDVRARCKRPVAVVLIHHENRAGAVSGAWEGAGDTLLHVRGAGHGHTIVYVQKARWASELHATTLKLEWADGESFALEEEKDYFVLICQLLADGKWRTGEEIRKAIGAGKETVENVLKDHPDDFRMRTGDEAVALGRHPSAHLYMVAPGEVD
jgi:hypothetical protein